MNTNLHHDPIYVKVIVRNGQLIVNEPLSLPDGTEGTVIFGNNADADSDDGWDNSPEGIARWLEWFDSLQLLLITPKEQADTDQSLREMGEQGWLKMEREAKEIYCHLQGH
ncbi:hypothetical protein [Zavarzinella formosa]|uniref:hypothetical protein n=1 Tax=Zavarzinella formosa TaxID=360055 RepID=UPI0002F1ED84|nr:hypothetical protein [Zavarzinella formosa]